MFHTGMPLPSCPLIEAPRQGSILNKDKIQFYTAKYKYLDASRKVYKVVSDFCRLCSSR